MQYVMNTNDNDSVIKGNRLLADGFHIAYAINESCIVISDEEDKALLTVGQYMKMNKGKFITKAASED